jgi:hypothetical protein
MRKEKGERREERRLLAASPLFLLNSKYRH